MIGLEAFQGEMIGLGAAVQVNVVFSVARVSTGDPGSADCGVLGWTWKQLVVLS